MLYFLLNKSSSAGYVTSSDGTKTLVTIPANDDWSLYLPKCKALVNNLQIYVPSNWKVSDDFPIYDGPYTNNPTTQAEKDFNSLASQCQIIIGFQAKPESYQAVTSGDYGTISVSADNITVPKSLDDLEKTIKSKPWFLKSDTFSKENINGNEFLFQNSPSTGEMSWNIIKNGWDIGFGLQIMNYSGDSKSLNLYLQKTIEIFVNKLVIK